MPDPGIPNRGLSGTWTPLSEVRTAHDKTSRQGIPWPESKAYKGLAQTLVWVLSGVTALPTQAGTRCCHVACGL
jgi:hypothetical protein